MNLEATQTRFHRHEAVAGIGRARRGPAVRAGRREVVDVAAAAEFYHQRQARREEVRSHARLLLAMFDEMGGTPYSRLKGDYANLKG